MKSHKISLMASLAVIAALLSAVSLASPGAYAAGAETLVLYNWSNPASDDFEFNVMSPGVISQEDDYLNFTLWSDPLDATATNATYYVLIYLYDGTSNVSLDNQSVAAKNDVRVYSNASYNDPGMSAFVTNGTCVLTVELWYLNLTATPDDYQQLDCVVTSFGVFATAAGAALMQFVPLIITVAMFAAIIPMLRKIGGKGKR